MTGQGMPFGSGSPGLVSIQRRPVNLPSVPRKAVTCLEQRISTPSSLCCLHFISESGDEVFRKPGDEGDVGTHAHQGASHVKSGVAVADDGHSFWKLPDFFPIQTSQECEAALDAFEVFPRGSELAVSPGADRYKDCPEALLEVLQFRR